MIWTSLVRGAYERLNLKHTFTDCLFQNDVLDLRSEGFLSLSLFRTLRRPCAVGMSQIEEYPVFCCIT